MVFNSSNLNLIKLDSAISKQGGEGSAGMSRVGYVTMERINKRDAEGRAETQSCGLSATSFAHALRTGRQDLFFHL